MIYDTKWNFSVKIGDNEWSISGIITKSKDTATATQRISLKVHQFVNKLIQSAEEGTLKIKQPTPEPPRTTFDGDWKLVVQNDEANWYPMPRVSLRIPGRKTVLETLIRIKKDIRGTI